MSGNKKSVDEYISLVVKYGFIFVIALIVIGFGLRSFKNYASNPENFEKSEGPSKYEYIPDFVLFPGEEKVIETNGRLLTFPPSKTLNGNYSEQKMDAFIFLKNGRRIVLDDIARRKVDFKHKAPSFSTIESVVFYIHKDGKPESFSGIKIHNY